ncbi:MAG: glycosyltransferase family 2 protein [Oligoflexia bacterium]|nr:glycosyltransferase family 2 protein [Oligoflexia bacterium]
MAQLPLSVTIITLNEEENIGRAIRSVSFADEVVVVDSGSQDQTVEIARGLGARVIHNPWPGYGAQKNFAQRNARNDWILNLDADEEVPPELAAELAAALRDALQTGRPRGFSMPRKTFYLGRWIRHGGWYPNLLCRLSDRRFASWSEPRVHESLVVQGETAVLRNPLHHHSFGSIRDQVLTNLRFAQLGSEELTRRGGRPGILRLLLKPPGKFVETYFLKRGFLDGLAGFIIAVNAAYSVFLKYAFTLEPAIRVSGRADYENPDHR